MESKEAPTWVEQITCPLCGKETLVYIDASDAGFEGKVKRVQAKIKPPATGTRKHHCVHCHKEIPLPFD